MSGCRCSGSAEQGGTPPPVPTRYADPVPAADPLPEYFPYRDEGCDLFPSCLACPLPRCRYDEQAEGRRPAKRLRDGELLRQRRLAGNSVAELAASFGVSKRTVQRIIRRSCSE